MKKKLVSLAITAFIFVLIFRSIDLDAFWDALSRIDYFYFFLALGYFLVYPLIAIERWRRMVLVRHPFRFRDAFRMYFLGQTLNLVLPSKAGDLARGYFLKKKKISSLYFGTSTIVLEKFLDLLSIGFAFIVALIFLGGGGQAVSKTLMIIAVLFVFFIFFLFLDKIRFFRVILYRSDLDRVHKAFMEAISFVRIMKRTHNTPLFLILIITSVLFWLGHLMQVFFFFKAANMDISYMEVLFYVPIAIFVGMIPVTVAGMGTRDAAFIFLMQDFIPRATIVLGGLLFSLRYILPALFGLFFIRDAMDYLSWDRRKKTETR
jgi:uncharacterized protein (TIRG00374 family)